MPRPAAERYNARQAAERLGMSASRLKEFLATEGIGAKTNGGTGHWALTEEDIQKVRARYFRKPACSTSQKGPAAPTGKLSDHLAESAFERVRERLKNG